MKRLLIISSLVLILPFLFAASCQPEPENEPNTAWLEVVTPNVFWDEIFFVINGDTSYYNGPITVYFSWDGADPFQVSIQGWKEDDWHTVYYETTIFLIDGDDKYLYLPNDAFWTIATY